MVLLGEVEGPRVGSKAEAGEGAASCDFSQNMQQNGAKLIHYWSSKEFELVNISIEQLLRKGS